MQFAPDGPMAIPLWKDGHAYLTSGTSFFDVVNPETGEAVNRVPLCGADEALETVNSARAAQAAWAEMGLNARRLCVARLADGLEGYAGHFAKLLNRETGVGEEAAAAEVAAAIAALRESGVGETGVIGIVIDATRPLAGFAATLAPAVLAGATLVVKPSPKAPGAIFALCELSARNDWPAGVLNLLQGDTAAIEGLIAAGIDRLEFRGERALGEKVGALAGATPFVLHAV